MITLNKRRYTDIAPQETHDKLASRIKSDARIGNRSTDIALAKRFTKADAPQYITDEEIEVDRNDLIISRADTRGTITYCNEIFTKMSGWTQEELLGSNHNLIRHPHMPKATYKIIWDNIKAEKEFYGYVKNLCKNGGYYWVFVYITADLDKNNKIAGYTSYRRYAPKLAINTIEPIYKLMIEAEKQGDIEASTALLEKILSKNGFTSYDQFIFDLQIKANMTLE